MASLCPGVLLRLLQDMDCPSRDASPRRRPLHAPASVLQITGIVPALSGSDLRPDRGFYVKVSDASHSTFVSLSSDLNDLILADRLQTGQLINVRRLEPASPVPVLRDFRLLSGRQPCNHDTVDVTYPSPAPKSSPVFRPSITTPPLPPPEKKKRHLRSHSFVSDHHRSLEVSTTSSPATSPLQRSVMKREEAKRRGSNSLDMLNNMTFSASADEENYDSDDSRLSFSSSSSSSPFTLQSRKNWDSGCKVAERRKYMKSQSARVSPQHSSFTSRNTEKTHNSVASPTKRKHADSDKTSSETSSASSYLCSPDDNYNTKCHDKINVIWALLPPNLIRQGKEVIRQRDTALQAAIDSLLEASASERLIECMNTYAELQANKDGDSQRVVNSFLDFHQKLAETRLIVQSCDFSSSGHASGRSVSQVASERKSCATSWIKAGMRSDLSKLPTQKNNAHEDLQVASSNPCTSSSKPKNNAAVSKGSSLLTASNALQYEFNRWFLRYIDKFLDSVSGSRSDSCESEVASLLCQLKRVDDWLNSIASKDSTWARDRVRETLSTEDDEVEACQRVKWKIYSVLMGHVESAAVALESMNVPDEEKDGELMLTS
ncbi:uncharacterized protein LOC121995093 [Zingiber officinale]|uniref:Uncharacterized protein n=1 Tax=Zingiber officinale TaxID=94328 RepID=A0A8J5KV66_ZINOF|nr:uncharacterized protein LOC121995093 [Zingiber officinale]KAG6500603.1 hypothetical protein ZIOFF_040451 [Zingiber officinale]